MGESAMAQFVYVPLVIVGLFLVLCFVAWLARNRPDSFFYRFAQWGISFLENWR